MKRIRKYIKNTPAFVIWLLAFVFFADAANLDDFIARVTIIHTDEPTENVTDDSPDSDIIIDHYKSFSNSSANENIPHTIRVLFDQDSPSLAPDFESFIIHNSENTSDKKLILISVSLSRTLYIEHHSLLI